MALRTARLLLRPLTPADADCVHRLMNNEAWLTHIGDRGIRTRRDAIRHLEDGPWTRDDQQGFGFYAVERHGVPEPMGICGLARRPHLDAPDLGFAFLPGYRGTGYAVEAAGAALDFAASLGLPRIIGTTPPGASSNR
ncbi:GNAT family N-acetyltransferase [Roseateles sp.]|uniref:GNAT family N-acetyltransferase n=1 Tax=Roseateles sp. TaxID=1971397 RepID=UPI0025D0A647|nr:GNAT family N-acetyltransferase [Roseateles sp.]